MAKRKWRGRTTPKASRRMRRKRMATVAERRKREFRYRGFNLEELKELPLLPPEEDPMAANLVSLLPARARRSLWKGLSKECQHLLDKLSSSDFEIRTHRREMIVLPQMVGKTIGIHNGRAFVQTEIKPEMIGHYLGEYAPTRGGVTHSGPGVGATRSSKFMPLK
ncbi:MAG TPA: 30S ribosomal protein S19 [Candidatus Poseidoniales archaeon]|nr:30S ribosomal protein S19 [Candidatus Poseidoniales archaeon]